MTLNKWRRATEWFMTALALVFLFAYSWEVLARTHILLCEMVINIIWMVFIATASFRSCWRKIRKPGSKTIC